MTYYPIKLFYSIQDDGFIAIIPDLPGTSAFGKTQENAIREINIVKELWIETARKEGTKIPEPSPIEFNINKDNKYSGTVYIRTPKSLHKQLVEKAKAEGVSLNQLCIYLLSKNLGISVSKD
ncbi:MAG: type II toxin-antitoxin system HicB family antitoxin [Candidatus Magnetoovum sp. WYHC-5]|nr:type II toxin-antitoxin system HicB family antitoxin [Candidatus Magnetoovum sp. WYHC-5]